VAGRIAGPSIPVEANAVGLAPTPDMSSVYVVDATGTAQQVAVPAGSVITTFPVGTSARDIAMSSNASIILVLKCPGAACNVSEIDAFGHSTITVLPAPLNTVSVRFSPDNSLVWDLVGTQAYGNVQAFSLT
jgi:DNA-binding beta-propeller fold protein YncE